MERKEELVFIIEGLTKNLLWYIDGDPGIDIHHLNDLTVDEYFKYGDQLWHLELLSKTSIKLLSYLDEYKQLVNE